MISIVPTILVKTAAEFKAKKKLIERDFTLAQIDVMDGDFVSNATWFDPAVLAKDSSPLKYELHLMVSDPLAYIKKLSGVLTPEIILFHYEAESDVKKIAAAIRATGARAGMAINPETDIEDIKNEIPEVDQIMLMGVHPGFSGQKFIPATVGRVAEIRRLHHTMPIEVDGGVDNHSAADLVAAGATILAVGSFLYKGKPVVQRNKILQQITA